MTCTVGELKVGRSVARAVVGLLATAGCAGAFALTELEDTALSGISARGLAFNLQNVSLSGDVAVTYRGAAGQRLTFGRLEVSRSDDPAATFADPYRLELNSRGAGHADALVLTTPLNSDDLLGWRLVADWSSFDGRTEFRGGALLIDNLQAHGNSLSLTAPDIGRPKAFVFGAGLQYDIDSIAFRPGGRDDLDPGRELKIRGIHLGGRYGGPWEIATLDNQPGTFRAMSDGSLQLQLDWPRDKMAPVGTVSIDNVDIFALLDFGFQAMLPVGSRAGIGIDRVQLQYLNVRLHP